LLIGKKKEIEEEEKMSSVADQLAREAGINTVFPGMCYFF
jgi:hypothetical protein